MTALSKLFNNIFRPGMAEIQHDSPTTSSSPSSDTAGTVNSRRRYAHAIEHGIRSRYQRNTAIAGAATDAKTARLLETETEAMNVRNLIQDLSKYPKNTVLLNKLLQHLDVLNNLILSICNESRPKQKTFNREFASNQLNSESSRLNSIRDEAKSLGSLIPELSEHQENGPLVDELLQRLDILNETIQKQSVSNSASTRLHTESHLTVDSSDRLRQQKFSQEIQKNLQNLIQELSNHEGNEELLHELLQKLDNLRK